MSIKIALAGNPNSGKTTLFNALTGSNQFVGNWPGVTVEKKEGKLKGHKDVVIMDLPGIYSLSPYTLEEVVARNYLIGDRPDAILNIVDGTNIERNLYLSTQLMELGIPVIMAINMMDLVEKNGDKIHIDKLSRKLGCEVVEISALKGTGIQKAAEKAVALAQQKKNMVPVHEFSKDAEDVITEVENKLSGIVSEDQKRFFAIKLLEKDDKIKEQMKSVPDVSYEIKEMEDKFDDDTESIITNERYVYISSIIGECVSKSSKEKLTTSDKIDRIVTNRWLAIPIFAVVMFLVYYVSVTTIGSILTDWTNDTLFGEWIIPGAQSLFENIGCADWLTGLIVDGVISGVGAVLGFVPQMLVLFLFLAFLESCGYMARVAFIMDRVFRKFGLSGKSFIPMLIGSGCGVPGVMASRTIESDRDRKMTILLTPFMSCSAKLPIYAFFVSAFFPEYGALVMCALYLGGIVIGILVALLYRKTLFRGDAVPFVMELPNYRLPGLKNVMQLLWEKAKDFLQKAFTVIFLATIWIWFLQKFDIHFNIVADSKDSMLALISNGLVPLFAPLGLGDWRICTSLISGVMAKESVISTLEILFGGNVQAALSDAAAASLLVFSLLYTPCVAALASIRRELGRKWVAGVIVWQCLVAWVAAFLVHGLALLF